MFCNYAFFYSRKIPFPCSLGTIPLAIANHWGLYMPKTSKAVSQGSLLEAASGNGLVGDEPRQNIVAAGYHAKYHPAQHMDPENHNVLRDVVLQPKGQCDFGGMVEGLGWKKIIEIPFHPQGKREKQQVPTAFRQKKDLRYSSTSFFWSRKHLKQQQRVGFCSWETETCWRETSWFFGDFQLAANCQLIFCGNQTGGSNDWSILTPTIEWCYNSKNTKNIWIKTCSSKHVKLLKTPTKKKTGTSGSTIQMWSSLQAETGTPAPSWWWQWGAPARCPLYNGLLGGLPWLIATTKGTYSYYLYTIVPDSTSNPMRSHIAQSVRFVAEESTKLSGPFGDKNLLHTKSCKLRLSLGIYKRVTIQS